MTYIEDMKANHKARTWINRKYYFLFGIWQFAILAAVIASPNRGTINTLNDLFPLAEPFLWMWLLFGAFKLMHFAYTDKPDNFEFLLSVAPVFILIFPSLLEFSEATMVAIVPKLADFGWSERAIAAHSLFLLLYLWTTLAFITSKVENGQAARAIQAQIMADNTTLRAQIETRDIAIRKLMEQQAEGKIVGTINNGTQEQILHTKTA